MLRIKTLVGCMGALIALSPVAMADVTLKGQVNRAVMYADDGVDNDTFFVDNDNSSTRIIIDAKHKLNDDVTIGGQFEVEHQSNSSDKVTINETASDSSQNAFQERKLEVYFESKSLGKLWLGQGDTASNETSEFDLSLTKVATYSEIGALGRSLKWRLANGGTIANGLTLGSVTNNFDGLSRDDRVRYDTPSLAGFKLSASAATAETYDVALTYTGDLGFAKVAGGVAYADFGKTSTSTLWDSQINGSLSLLFKFGLSLTGTVGTRMFADNTARDLSGDDEPINYWGKVGYEFAALPAGKTAVSVEYGMTNDFAAKDDEFTVYGASLVQEIKSASTELFLTYRNYQLDRNNAIYGADPEDIFVVMGGARVKF